MESIFKTRIIQIGNSQGIRIPKPLLERFHIHNEVELSIKDGFLVLHPTLHPRAGWEAQCQLMAERGDDQLLDANLVNASRWDDEEWEW